MHISYPIKILLSSKEVKCYKMSDWWLAYHFRVSLFILISAQRRFGAFTNTSNEREPFLLSFTALSYRRCPIRPFGAPSPRGEGLRYEDRINSYSLRASPRFVILSGEKRRM